MKQRIIGIDMAYAHDCRARTFFKVGTWPILIAVFTIVLFKVVLDLDVLPEANPSYGFKTSGYHSNYRWDENTPFNPLADFWLFLQFSVIDLNQNTHQWIFVAQHAIIGVLVYFFYLECSRRRELSAAAAIMFVASSGYYESTLWNAIGVGYLMSAVFIVLALIALSRYSSSSASLHLLVFYGAFLAALISNSIGVILVPVSLIYTILIGYQNSQGNVDWKRLASRSFFFTLVKTVGVSAMILYLFLLIKSNVDGALFLSVRPPFLPHGLFSFLRGFISNLTLRSDPDFILNAIALGGPHLYIAPEWFLIVSLIVYIVYKVGDALDIFCVLWTLGYLFILAVFVGVETYHLYLSAIPTALLLTRMIYRMMKRAQIYLGVKDYKRSFVQGIPKALGVVVYAVIVVPSLIDLCRARAVWNAVDEVKTQMLERIRRSVQEDRIASDLFIVNPVIEIEQDGFIAWLGETDLLMSIRMEFPERFHTISLVFTSQDQEMDVTDRAITFQELNLAALYPQNLILSYDVERRDAFLVQRETWMAVRNVQVYDARTAPFLDWQEGAWPYLVLDTNEPFELAFHQLSGNVHWASLFFLQQAESDFEVYLGNEIITRFNPQDPNTQAWTTANFHLPENILYDPFRIVVQKHGSRTLLVGRVAVFTPRQTYIMGTAPFLNWQEGAWPWVPIAPSDSLTLPFLIDQNHQNIISIYYAHEDGREFLIELDGIPPTLIDPSPEEPAEWRYIEFQVPSTTSNMISVTIEGVGSIPVMIGEVELVAENQVSDPPE